MGLLSRQKLTPPPNNDIITKEQEQRIRELKEQLSAVEQRIKTGNAATSSDIPHPSVGIMEDNPLPPKFEEVQKEQPKMQLVPISFEELVSIQFDEIKALLTKIDEKLR